MVQEIKGKIVGFKKDGTLLVFDSKEDQMNYDFEKNQVSMVFTSPGFIKMHIDDIENELMELQYQLDELT